MDNFFELALVARVNGTPVILARLERVHLEFERTTPM
jgi:hypothetical protein